MVLLPLLLRGLPVHRGPLEVELLVDPEVVGEHVAHHHHVVLHVVHGQAVHAEVLREQGLAWKGGISVEKSQRASVISCS